MGNKQPIEPEMLRRSILMTMEKGPDFSMDGEEYIARVVDVYDGDTCRIVFYRNGEYQQHRARMNGYDSPEIKPSLTLVLRDKHIEAAKIAKNELIGMIFKPEQLVKVKCGKNDKYGRLLVTIFLENGINVNEWMVAHHFGIPYHGGTKKG